MHITPLMPVVTSGATFEVSAAFMRAYDSDHDARVSVPERTRLAAEEFSWNSGTTRTYATSTLFERADANRDGFTDDNELHSAVLDVNKLFYVYPGTLESMDLGETFTTTYDHEASTIVSWDPHDDPPCSDPNEPPPNGWGQW